MCAMCAMTVWGLLPGSHFIIVITPHHQAHILTTKNWASVTCRTPFVDCGVACGCGQMRGSNFWHLDVFSLFDLSSQPVSTCMKWHGLKSRNSDCESLFARIEISGQLWVRMFDCFCATRFLAAAFAFEPQTWKSRINCND